MLAKNYFAFSLDRIDTPYKMADQNPLKTNVYTVPMLKFTFEAS